MKGFFNIDINTTTKCNLRCSYCVEPFKDTKDFCGDTLGTFLSEVMELLNSKFISTRYLGITICFWGGEPTTNSNTIKKVIEHFRNEDRVKFLIYSNGYSLDKIKEDLLRYKDVRVLEVHPKVFLQISYDGGAS